MKLSSTTWALAEAITGAVAIAVSALTVAWPGWIEGVLGIDPDAGNGSIERLIAAGSALVAVGLLAAARRDWKRRTTG